MKEKEQIFIASPFPEKRSRIRKFLDSSWKNQIEILEAENGNNALKLALERHFDCILSDEDLTDMTGLELYNLFRARGGRDTAFIILTAGEKEGIGIQVIKEEAPELVPYEGINEFSLRLAVDLVIEKKQIQKSLRDQQGFHRGLLESISDPIFIRDIHGALLDCNTAFSEFFGLDISSLKGQPLKKIFRIPMSGLFPSNPALSPGPCIHETILINASGDERAFLIKDMPIFNEVREIAGFVSVMFDITEKKKAEDELRKLRRVLDLSPASIVITDSRGNIEYVNPKFSRLTGYTPEEALGENPRILKSGEQPREYYEHLWSTILTGQEWQGEFHNRKKNGEYYWELASIAPVKNEKGEISHFLAVKEDITQRKLAEEALRISEKNLSERNRIMEEELELARVAQAALLPGIIPQLDFIRTDYRYYPLGKVGGDYFSFFPDREGELGFFIGDVSGHGVASALFLALVKSATDKLFRQKGDHPAEYLEQLNKKLKGFMSTYFITGIYGLFKNNQDFPGVRLSLANGGHPYPMIVKKDGSIRRFIAGGTLIGVMDDVSYDAFELDLDPGDRVFLFTDGIPEAENTRKEIIGFEEGLIELFRKTNRGDLEETLDSVIDEVHAFMEGAPPGDDIIIIGFEVI